MDDTAKDVMILVVLGEEGGGLTVSQIAARTVMYQAPVPVRDVTQDLRKPQVWHITPEGIKWAARNRRR